MVNRKFLNLIVLISLVASLVFNGNISVKAQTPPPPAPQGAPATGPRPATAISPAQRKAAAKIATAKGLLPGVAGIESQQPSLARPGMATSAAAPAAPAMAPNTVPHFFGPFANYANSPSPTGPINGITVDFPGSGYTAPVVDIVDAYGLGSGATATAQFDALTGAITGFTMLTNGSGYSAPMVTITDPTGTGAAGIPVMGNTPGSLTGGIRKFVDTLPGLGAANANKNLQADGMGQYIPVAIPDKTTFPGSDYYEIELGQYTEKLHSDLPATTLRGYRQTNTSDPTVSVFHYLGPLIVATRDTPIRIKFTNKLPTGAGGNLFLPVDSTVMGAGPGPNMPAMPADLLHPMCNTMDQTVVKDPNCYSENRATLHLHGGLVPWISDGTPHQWTTPAGEATSYPKGVSVQYVPDMWYDATGNVVPAGTAGASNNPGDGSLTFYYNNQQSARLMFYHDHAYGITRLNVYAGEAAGYLITDQVESDLINGTNVSGVNPGLVKILPDVGIPLILQDKTFVDATTIAAQDPTWNWGLDPLTGLPTTGSLWVPHVYMPAQNPSDVTGASAFGRWMYGPWFWPPTKGITQGPVANEYYDPLCDPTTTWCEPPLRPGVPNMSVGMEAFNDTPLVNGTAYPSLTVDPKTYRFRVLNAADDRFFNLHMYVADPTVVAADGRTNTEVKMVPAVRTAGFPAKWSTDGRAGGVPDPATAGPSWIQIGTEGGFLPAPVVVPPQPINYNNNPMSFNFGNVTDHSLLLGVAERADVLVDFSKYAGKTLIVYNDAPAAFPAIDPRYDYYTGNPDQMTTGGAPSTRPGYGPNTRTVMQIKVNNIAPAPAFNLAVLQGIFAKTAAKRGVFEVSQDPIIVPQAAYNSAYNATLPATTAAQYVQIADTSKTFTPLGATTPVTIPFEEKSAHDEMGAAYDTDYGRMSGLLGLELPVSTNLNQNILLYGFASPPVEVMKDSTGSQIGTLADGTEIWKITHNGVDTHPMHFHLFNVQLINRVAWDGALLPPEPQELGWKETVRMNPLESLIVAMRPVAPTQPFDLPNSVRFIDPTLPDGAPLMGPPGGFLDPLATPVTITNHKVNYGWEYVWHCHILSHEEMDMMHSIAFAVAPKAPSNLAAAVSPGSAVLTWTDNSANETGFTIQRAADSTFATGLVSFTVPENTTTYTDSTITDNVGYYYQVIANNLVGDNATNIASATVFPIQKVDSAPSNLLQIGTVFLPAAPTGLTATLQAGPQVALAWTDNSAGAASFVVERSVNGGAFAQIAAPAAGTVTYLDTTVAIGPTPNVYAYRVAAVNTGVMSAYSNTATVTVNPNPPAAPTGLTATLQAGPQVALAWTNNATNQTGYVVERSSDNGLTFAPIASGLAASAVSYTDTTVAAGLNPNTYVYRVAASNASGLSLYSNTATVVVPPTVPAAPTGLTAVLQAGPQIALAWVDNATNETGFVIERADNGAAFAQLTAPAANATAFIDTTVVAGHTYDYRVTAVNTGGSSAPSNTVTVAVPAIPGAPTGLTAVLQGGPQIALTWVDNANNETGFVLQRSVNGGAFAQLTAPAANVTSFVDTTVAVGNTYAYQVQAVNLGGASAFSNTATVVVPLPIVPAAPTTLSARLLNGSQVSLTWTDRATNETGFVIERADNGGAFVQIATVPARIGTGTVSYTDTTVVVGPVTANSYQYRVKAMNGITSSAYTNIVTIVVPIPAIPNAPSGLTVTLVSGPSVSVRFIDRSSNETGFIVERADNGGAFMQIAALAARGGVGGAVTFSDTSVLDASSYVYRVKAVNGISSSLYSATATVNIPLLAAAPSGFGATTVRATPTSTTSNVTLTWTDNATSETGFTLQRATNATFTRGLASTNLAANTVTLTQTGLARNAVYYYRIQAFNTAGRSVWVNLPSITTAP
jgi:FtsP/CotA-like multicopper oxidase with cupredoxin domain/fibronectin type 3 domain-containing protein